MDLQKIFINVNSKYFWTLGTQRVHMQVQVQDEKKYTHTHPMLTVNLVLQLDTEQEIRSRAFSPPREVQKL